MKSLLPPELQPGWNVRDTVPRRDRFAELAFAGYSIPRCGQFRDMARLGVPLVVYRDEFAHCGEGKELVRPGDLTLYDPTAFCVEYMPTQPPDGEASCSQRLLVVGSFAFGLSYFSTSSWMSNVGGEYTLTDWNSQFCRDADLLAYPMYAIDFVGPLRDTAIDLNVCPFVPLEVVNLAGRDALAGSVAKFCRDRGLIA